MKLSNELKKIKKIYGEDFMKYCRAHFPTILEQEGVLYSILEESISSNCYGICDNLDDIEEITRPFEQFILNKYNKRQNKEEAEEIEEKIETPFELLDKAGYDLYECFDVSDILKFEKYYHEDEALCTFDEPDVRLARGSVFFAVKKDVDKIKREDFENPCREDLYGTSVMSIQFDYYGNVSIKNRYNHSVNNPDATYGNNLNNIIQGLEQSFCKYIEPDLEIKKQTQGEMSLFSENFVMTSTGKIYRYNEEIDCYEKYGDRICHTGRIYYCPGNIIIDNTTVFELDPNKELLIDYFILDL